MSNGLGSPADVPGAAALGSTNNELTPESGFPGDIQEAGIDPAISAGGSRRGQTQECGGEGEFLR